MCSNHFIEDFHARVHDIQKKVREEKEKKSTRSEKFLGTLR